MLPIDTSGLIYNRTNADSYEASDLNRVGKMCDTIAQAAADEIAKNNDMLKEYDVAANKYTVPNFAVPKVNTKTDFTTVDTYTIEQMATYLANVRSIITEFPPKVYKEMPQNMRFLRAQSVNNIEENLKQSAENLALRTDKTQANIKNTASAFYYGGELYSGGII